MVAPVLTPAGTDSTLRPSSVGRNGGSSSGLPVASVKVYIPANTEWVHLWTGQKVSSSGSNSASVSAKGSVSGSSSGSEGRSASGSSSGSVSGSWSVGGSGGVSGASVSNSEGRYVSVDAPIGYPPVFYLTHSVAGKKLREFVIQNGYHAKYPSSSSSSSISSISTDSDTDTYTVTSSGIVTTNTKISNVSDRKLQETVTHSSNHNGNSNKKSTYKKYTIEAIVGEITDYVAPDWAEWLGISQYVSKWNSTYYAIPTTTSTSTSTLSAISGSFSGSSSGIGSSSGPGSGIGSGSGITFGISSGSGISSSSQDKSSSSLDIDWIPSIHSTSSIIGEKGLGLIIDVGAVNVNNNGNSMMFQDIDVDLSSLFQS